MTHSTLVMDAETAVDSVPARQFVPEITAFTCIYCGYMAADTAGALRLEYPPSIKLLKLPCTGKVDVEYILKAFEHGADGVYIVACPQGNCHHVEGNVRATKRVAYAKKLLEDIGLEGERVEIFYVSGGQGATFAEAARTMTERIRKLGPNPLRQYAAGTPPCGSIDD